MTPTTTAPIIRVGTVFRATGRVWRVSGKAQHGWNATDETGRIATFSSRAIADAVAGITKGE